MLVSRQEPVNERQFRRHQLIYRLSVFDSNSQQLIGYVVDLSIGGALLITSMAIKSKVKMRIRIEFPHAFLDAKFIEIFIEVVRVSQDINPDYFCIGIRFLDTSYEDQITIDNIIENYSF